MSDNPKNPSGGTETEYNLPAVVAGKLHLDIRLGILAAEVFINQIILLKLVQISFFQQDLILMA